MQGFRDGGCDVETDRTEKSYDLNAPYCVYIKYVLCIMLNLHVWLYSRFCLYHVPVYISCHFIFPFAYVC